MGIALSVACPFLSQIKLLLGIIKIIAPTLVPILIMRLMIQRKEKSVVEMTEIYTLTWTNGKGLEKTITISGQDNGYWFIAFVDQKGQHKYQRSCSIESAKKHARKFYEAPQKLRFIKK